MRKIFLVLLIISIIITGCTKKGLNNISETDNLNEKNYDPFETGGNTDNEAASEEIGSITHGVLTSQNSETAENNIVYQGGELQLNYFIIADGIAKKTGFLIYVDGIPQPYKIELNGVDMDYQYMHELELEGGKETDFTFVFTPVTGKKGDILPIIITSITYPSYAPDMVETSSYGYAHQALDANYSIAFEQDTEGMKGLNLTPEVCLSDVTIENTVFDSGQEEKYTSGLNTYDFDKQVYSKLYLDDEDMKIASSYNTNGKNMLHVRYEITGHPGLKYRSILYLNHQPISSQDAYYFESDLQKGYISVMEFDLDVSKLDGNETFYIVSVPCNANDYPNDVVRLIKYRSILLYDSQNIDSGKETKEEIREGINGSGSDTGTQQMTDYNMKAKELEFNDIDEIEEVCYAGGNKLFLLADKLYLYDSDKKAVIAKVVRHPGLNSLKTLQLENGFVVVGTTGEEKETVAVWGATDGKKMKSYNMECTFYDEDLHITSTFDIAKVMGIDVLDPSAVAVSSDGKMIACIDSGGLYLYDRSKNNKTCIVNTVNNKSAEVNNMNFTNIVFADSNQKLIFLSQNLGADPDENQQSESAYGTVNVDGSDLMSYSGHGLAKINVYPDKALMSQEVSLNGASGKASVYYYKNQNMEEYSLVEAAESENIWGSDTGKYFATSVRKDGKGWLIRIYDMDTGEKVYEKMYLLTDTDNFKEPYIYLLDSEKKVMLYFRTLKDEVKTRLVMAEF